MEGKMQSKKYFVAGASVLGLAFILFLTSCDSNGAGGGTVLPPSYTTIEWETDAEGFKQFSTNDPQHHSIGSLSRYANPKIATPNIYEIEIKKLSGHRYTGYGMAFCASPTSRYLVLITIDGYYRKIAKYIGNTPTVLNSGTDIYDEDNWSNDPHPSLNTGYGVLNTIKVEQSAEDTFKLYFNGDLVDTFTDTGTPLTGKGVGGIVFVGDSTDEKFPGTPVDVRMKVK